MAALVLDAIGTVDGRPAGGEVQAAELGDGLAGAGHQNPRQDEAEQGDQLGHARDIETGDHAKPPTSSKGAS